MDFQASLVLGLVVELVGKPGEVVAYLLAHGNSDLLTLPLQGQDKVAADKGHNKTSPKCCRIPHSFYFQPL